MNIVLIQRGSAKGEHPVMWYRGNTPIVTPRRVLVETKATYHLVVVVQPVKLLRRQKRVIQELLLYWDEGEWREREEPATCKKDRDKGEIAGSAHSELAATERRTKSNGDDICASQHRVQPTRKATLWTITPPELRPSPATTIDRNC